MYVLPIYLHAKLHAKLSTNWEGCNEAFFWLIRLNSLPIASRLSEATSSPTLRPICQVRRRMRICLGS